MRSFSLVAALLAILAALVGCGADKDIAAVEPSPALAAPLSLTQAQDELDSLAAPDGVDPAVFEELTRELSRLLSEQADPARLASATVQRQRDRAILGYSDGALRWSYRSSGDYDQNGEVNIADLSALAKQFGRPGPFGRDSLESVADGDSNGEVGISDVSPIAASFGLRVSGFNIYASADPADYPAVEGAPNGPGSQLLGTLPLSSGTGEGRLQFSFPMESQSGRQFWLRPLDGKTDGIASVAWPAGYWPMPGHDAQNSNRSLYNGPASPGNVTSLESGGGVRNQPLLAADGSIQTWQNDLFVSLDSTGTLNWSIPSEYNANSDSNIGPDGSIYLTGIGSLWPEGRLRHGAFAGLGLIVPGMDGRLYAISTKEELVCLDQIGNPIWKTALEGYLFNPPVIAPNGNLIVTERDVSHEPSQKYVYAISPEGQLLWSSPSSGTQYAQPAIARDGTIYLPMDPNILAAISPDGEELWRFHTSAFIRAAPALALDGSIVLCGGDSRVYCLSPDGKLSWTYQTDYTSYASPCIGGDGSIYISSAKLCAISPQGKLLWQQDLGSSCVSTPLIGPSESLIVGTQDGRLHIIGDRSGNLPPVASISSATPGSYLPYIMQFDASQSVDPDGSLVSYEWDWDADGTTDEISSSAQVTHEYTEDGFHSARVKVVDNLGYTASASVLIALPSPWPVGGQNARRTGRTQGIASSDPQLLWRAQLSSYTQGSSPVMGADGSIYIGSAGGLLNRVDPRGLLQWAKGTDSPISCTPAVSNSGVVYVGNNAGELHAFSASGTAYWTFPAAGPIHSSPVLAADGTIYVGSDGNELLAITPTGELSWRFETQAAVRSSPALDLAGNICFGCRDGKLYCLSPEGQLLWDFQTAAAVDSSPAIDDDGAIWFGGNDGLLYVLNADGSLRESRDAKVPLPKSPAISSSGLVYICSNNMWSFEAGDSHFFKLLSGRYDDYDQRAAIDGHDTVIHDFVPGELKAYQPGAVLQWVIPITIDDPCSPLIDQQGTIYYSNAGYLYAYGDPD